MAVTMKEVAQEAGVSLGAVSKVLYGGASSIRVGSESARRIREAAVRLNYIPNGVARSLRSRCTRTVGVIFENLHGFAEGPLYAMYLLDGLAKAVFPEHYRISILPELDRSDVIGSLADGRIDGAIWCKLARDEAISQLIEDCPIPIVALNAGNPAAESKAVYIGSDNQGGMALAVDHLVDLGHRRIAFMCEEGEQFTPDSEARREGFTARMSAHGLAGELGNHLIWSWELDEFGPWWDSRPPVTAVICWSERCAAKLLERAAQAGVVVPHQLSVVGFDSTPYCDVVSPKLTSVRQPIREMAELAGTTLLALLRGEHSPSPSFVLPCDFDVRDSTAPPASPNF
jgi:LacI family transcriptional regulator